MHGKAQKVTIYIGESNHLHGKALYMALLEYLRREGASGATVTRGLAGYGAHSRIHTANIVSLSADLPIVVEWVDTLARIEMLLPRVKEMVTDGLITIQEVEVVRHVPARPRDPLALPVATLMSRNVVSVLPATPLHEAVDLVGSKGYRCLPVVDETRRVVGIVTDGDLLRHTGLPLRLGLQPVLSPAAIQEEVAKLRAEGRQVGQIMTKPVVSVYATDRLRVAAETMVEKDLKRLPVVDEVGKLVGLISRVDVLRAMQEDVATGDRQRGTLQAGGTLAELMVRDAPSVQLEAKLDEIVRALEKGHQQRVVVVDRNHRVLGIITDGDLLRRSMYGQDPSLRARLRGLVTGKPRTSVSLPKADETASELMTTPAVTVPVTAPLSEVLRIMLSHRLKRLPVVDDHGRLLGVVGRASVLRGLIEESARPA